MKKAQYGGGCNASGPYGVCLVPGRHVFSALAGLGTAISVSRVPSERPTSSALRPPLSLYFASVQKKTEKNPFKPVTAECGVRAVYAYFLFGHNLI